MRAVALTDYGDVDKLELRAARLPLEQTRAAQTLPEIGAGGAGGKVLLRMP
jgi:hypothetical protein